jgi:hypothetical protein
MPSVAIIGASNDRRKFGNKAVRAFAQKGFTVYPINLREDVIEGLKAYKSVLDLPEVPDAANFYVSPSVGIKVIEEVAAKGIKQALLNPGTESDDLIARAEELGVTPVPG